MSDAVGAETGTAGLSRPAPFVTGAKGGAGGAGGAAVSIRGGGSMGLAMTSSIGGLASVSWVRIDGFLGDIRSIFLGGGATGEVGSGRSREGSRD